MSDEARLAVRTTYSAEFKTEAIKLVLQQDYTCGQAGEQLVAQSKVGLRYYL
jgi:hypothetical protein